MLRGFELSGSLVRDVWADDSLWLVRTRWGTGYLARAGGPGETRLRPVRARPSFNWRRPPARRALAG
jgi:hypothetical protein